MIQSIQNLISFEGAFVHSRTFASYIVSPLIRYFIQFLVIKMGPGAAVPQTSGPLLIKSRMKQRQGQSQRGVMGKIKQLFKEITNFVYLSDIIL